MANQDGSGGNKSFAIAPGDDLTVDAFGSFGSGAAPSAPGELDTLVFSGAGLSAGNMILTQVGANVVVTFAGVPDTRVTLTNTTIELLENIVALGNFQFNGESAVTDSVDVWSASQFQSTIDQANIATFLNALPNDVSGKDASNDVINGLEGNDHISGGSGNDLLRGGDGNDTLDGGLGDDRMEGGRGNDIYIVDSPGDQVVESTPNSKDGGWSDEVRSSISFSLAGLPNIERLTLTGTGNINGTGNSGHNVIKGNVGNNVLKGGNGNDSLAGDDGNDTLDGGAGHDTLAGGRGNDVYIVDSIHDVVVENVPNSKNGGWSDEVRSSVSFSLASLQNIERLTLTGIGDINGKGNSGHNALAGNDGDNVLDGGNGNDRIRGGDGNDTLLGGNGQDDLMGGSGDDELSGGMHSDIIDGGDGNDTAVFSGKLADYTITNLSGVITVKDNVTSNGNDGTDKLIDVEFLQFQDAKVASIIDLATLDGTNGFTLIGIGERDQSGYSVSSAGDVNGDGFDDVIVGAPRAEVAGGGYAGGQSYVVFGKANWAGTPSFDLATLDGTEGFRLVGVDAYDRSGISVSSAGDVNGDGFADVIVGAYEATSTGGGVGEGESYVMFGKVNWTGTPSVDLATLNGTNGFSLIGVDAYDASGRSVSSAGDVNGDGFADLIVGAYIANDAGGESYVVFGKASWAGTPSLDLATLDGTNGFRLVGIDGNDFSGFSVSSVGDVNGDGFDDVIVGAPLAENDGGPSFQGEAYVVFGKASWAGTPSLELSTLDGTSGFRLIGANLYDEAGFSVSSAGDVNGDGLDDLIVGALLTDSAGQTYGEGASYVIFGKESWAGTPSLVLETVDGTNGFRLMGIDQYDYAGISVSSAGDVNGDGFDDLIIGASGAESPGGGDHEGESYVVFGKATWAGIPSLDLKTLDGTNGFRLIGIDALDLSGQSVSSAGDINGDGFADLVVGAPYAQSTGGATGEGESYVIFGGNFSGAVTHLGTADNDTLTGTGADETFVGGLGNDALVGGGGKDAFQGGAGNDAILVGSVLPLDVDGGSGVDTMNLDALGASIDLSGLASSRFVDIEKIDLGGVNANTLVLDAQSVFDMSGTNGDAFADNTLLAKGDVGDAVSLVGSWTKGATLLNPFGETGSFVSYTSGQAQVLVESDLTVQIGAFAALNLATLDGTNGFRLIGIDESDLSGRSVSSAGDVNGDGFDDVIVGAPSADSGGGEYGQGESYVVFGKASWVGTPSLDLATLDGTNGFRLVGIDKEDLSGFSVSSAGDVNGDGFADVIIGAIAAESSGGENYEGESYVVFGKANWSGTPSLELATLDGTNGVRLIGIDANDRSSRSASSAGDVNGDGFDDLIVGAYLAESAGGVEGEGESYVVFGKASWAGVPSLDLATLDGTNGFRLIGIDFYDTSGYSVSSAGDVNGDGFDDLIVGAPHAQSAGGEYQGGESYVVFGKANWAGTPSIDLATLDGTNGFSLIGIDEDDHSGWSVSSAGDVNGDGFADLIVGAVFAESAGGGDIEGESYVVFGKANWAGVPSLDLATLDGTNGFRLIGIDKFDFSGYSVSSAGDVNGDGFADLIVGTPFAYSVSGSEDQGESYVVFGKASWIGTPSLDLAALDGTNGFRLIGIDGGDDSGHSVSSAGDVNGDGFADLIVGAPDAESAGGASYEGESYVVFGGSFTGAVTHLGGAGDDTLTGTDADETFVGSLGNDTLIGGGGVDAFQGGAGDDAVHVSDGSFKRVDGGNGADTLHLDFGGLIDLGNIDGDAATADHTKIQNVETIDTDNGSSNQIAVRLADILHIDADDRDVGGVASLDNVLKIDGDAGDTLSLNPADGWSAADTTTLTDYAVYTAGNVKIAIDQDIVVAVA